PAIRQHLTTSGRYRFLPSTEARDVSRTPHGTVQVRDDHATVHETDLVLVCPGATLGGLARDLAGDLPLRRVRLQMMQTAPLGGDLTTSPSGGGSLRYYPGFAGAALDDLAASEEQRPVAARHRMQLLCVPRLHGGLPIGDTHAYDE